MKLVPASTPLDPDLREPSPPVDTTVRLYLDKSQDWQIEVKINGDVWHKRDTWPLGKRRPSDRRVLRNVRAAQRKYDRNQRRTAAEINYRVEV